eukprot:4523124-Amphidinium_carterae.1
MSGRYHTSQPWAVLLTEGIAIKASNRPEEATRAAIETVVSSLICKHTGYSGCWSHRRHRPPDM